MEWVWENAEKLGSLASLVGAVTAVFAIGFAAGQIAANRVATREATALKSYTEHVRSCVDRPHLCTWTRFAEWSGVSSARDVAPARDDKAEAYVWFVREMLIVCELVLLTADRDKGWCATVEAHAEMHKEFLREVWPSWRERFSAELCKVVGRVLRA